MQLASLVFTLFLGCVPKQVNPSDLSIFQHPPPPENLIPFETTNSPCMDAMIVNMTAAGCENIIDAQEYTDNYTGMVYFCSDHNSDSEWNKSKFHIVSHENYDMTDDVFMGFIPFCSDIHVMMFIE